jgi:lysylphosphatidylglycerol synthetase-like protein (DUF2156 family)
MSKINNAFDRIDISTIFQQHKTTFYHYEKKKFYNKSEVPFSDKVLFVLFPLILSALLCFVGLKFNKDYVNITLTCLSIFAGLLFGLLTLVFSLIQENQKSVLENSNEDLVINIEIKKKLSAKIDLTKHLFINIAFSIVLTVFALVFVLLTQFYPTNLIEVIKSWALYVTFKNIYLYITNWVSIFLIIEFVLTLLMIIRRFTMIFINQTEE